MNCSSRRLGWRIPAPNPARSERLRPRWCSTPAPRGGRRQTPALSRLRTGQRRLPSAGAPPGREHYVVEFDPPWRSQDQPLTGSQNDPHEGESAGLAERGKSADGRVRCGRVPQFNGLDGERNRDCLVHTPQRQPPGPATDRLGVGVFLGDDGSYVLFVLNEGRQPRCGPDEPYSSPDRIRLDCALERQLSSHGPGLPLRLPVASGKVTQNETARRSPGFSVSAEVCFRSARRTWCRSRCAPWRGTACRPSTRSPPRSRRARADLYVPFRPRVRQRGQEFDFAVALCKSISAMPDVAAEIAVNLERRMRVEHVRDRFAQDSSRTFRICKHGRRRPRRAQQIDAPAVAQPVALSPRFSSDFFAGGGKFGVPRKVIWAPGKSP